MVDKILLVLLSMTKVVSNSLPPVYERCTSATILKCDEKYITLTANIVCLHLRTRQVQACILYLGIISPIKGAHVSQCVRRSLAEGFSVTSTIVGHKF